MASTSESDEPLVLRTDNDDGSAEFTVQHDEEDHKFSITPDGVLRYDESLSWRGVVRVSTPREEVWRILQQSDAMTEYLEKHDLPSVEQQKHG